MSLERIRPQGYAPIRVDQSQVGHFFKLLQDRKIAKGDQLSFKLTDKPLIDKTAPQRDIGVVAGSSKSNKSRDLGVADQTTTQTNTKKSNTSKKRSNSGGSVKKASGKKKKVKIEARLAKAKI